MNNIKRVLAGAAVATAMTLGATAANAVTIVNGSFELGAVNPVSFTALAGGDSTSITGWTVGGGGVDYIGSYWQAADGDRSLDLSNLSAGSISQLLSGLSIGSKYRVTFALAGNPDGGGSTKVLVASDGGAQTQQFNFIQAPNTKANMGWTYQTFDFVAGASTANLTFASSENNPFGPALDDVSIAGVVPEPATWAMMIMGFGGVGAMVRRRRTAGVAQTA